MVNYNIINEEEERKKQQLQAEMSRNDMIIDRKTDELNTILYKKIRNNTFVAKTYTDICDKAEAITDKMYSLLDKMKEAEKLYPEIKATNERYEKAIHELESVITELQEKAVMYQNEADRLISARKAELIHQLDDVTKVPAYRHKQAEQQEAARKKSTERKELCDERI